MPVNLEIKGMLAKCLAMEDIIVEHKKVETACFNVHTRCLTLPLWEKASNDVYTMLVLHEISHSLFTPNEDWSKNTKVPQQFVNLVEDARVEKLCKRKYPGSPKSFFNGYKELAEQDFFSIGDDDLSTYNLADKANLYFKIGNFIKLDFDIEEQEIINLIGSTETFADVLIAAEELYKYCKQKDQEQTKISLDSHENQTSGAGNSGPSDFDNQEQGENDQPESEGSEGSASEDEGQKKQQKPQDSKKQSTPEGGEKNEDPEVKTMEALEEALKELVNENGHENVYLEIPQVDLNKIIVPNDQIHSGCKLHWNQFIERNGDGIFDDVDSNFLDFKRSAQKEVNYLVKEFECRKAADSYARATTARTGVLDCSRLHNYKFSEDLFKKVTTLADGKNHGLIFVLDWSGSMQNVMLDTVKQLFNLVWFCKKVSIPFEVYAFTTDYPLVAYDEDRKANIRELSYEKRDGLFQVGEWFTMMNLLTSKVNSKTLEEQMKNIFRIAFSFKNYCYYGIPSGLSLSGTPLNESLICLHQILPKFQRENKLQKVQCVVLTDGEACGIKYHKEFHRKWEEEPYIGTNHIHGDCFLRNRKTGNTYSLRCEWHGMTDIFLLNLRDSFPDVNFIGIRVLESRDSAHFIRRYCGYYGPNYDKMMNAWKKEKSFTIKSSGYHSYFGISANVLSQDTEFDVHECASKSQIKNAFMKSLKGKKMNKKILGEFIELIA